MYSSEIHRLRWVRVKSYFTGLLRRLFLSQEARNQVNNDFLQAIVSGDFEHIKTAIAAGADINLSSIRIDMPADTGSAIHRAAFEGEIAAVEFLVRQGCSVDIRSQNGWTPLTIALDQNHEQVAAALLDFGSNPNTPGGPLSTKPLVYASGNGLADSVKLLLEKGAKPTMSALKSAVLNYKEKAGAHPDVIRILIEAGADQDTDLDTQWSPRMDAVYHGKKDVLPLLKNSRRAHIIDAVLDGQIETIRSFFQAGNLTASDQNRTPLIWAAYCGDTDIIHCLVDAGADVDFTGLGKGLDQALVTPAFDIASQQGHTEAAAYLLRAGANVEPGRVMEAAKTGDHDLLDRLLADAPDFAYAALHGAVRERDHILAVYICEKYKVDVNARMWSRTPLMEAAALGDDAMAGILIDYGADIWESVSDVTPFHALHFAILGSTDISWVEDDEATLASIKDDREEKRDKPIVKFLEELGMTV